MIGALTRHWAEEPRTFAKPVRSSAPLSGNPHGRPEPICCVRCGKVTATYWAEPPRYCRNCGNDNPVMWERP